MELTINEIIANLSDSLKQEINSVDFNPARYGGELFDRAYEEIYGDDIISDSQEIVFEDAIERVWRG